MNKKEKERESAEAKAFLLKHIKPGQRIYTVLKHVASSGMSRRIECLIPSENHKGEPSIINISWYVAKACGFRLSKGNEIVVGGCGMDMGYHIVYSLSSVLFDGNFICIGEGCPSNDHNNGSNDYTPHLHSNGGYALTHSWL